MNIASAHASARATSRAPRTVDELLELEADALRELYHDASVPKLQELDGDLRGRLLAVPQLPPLLAALPRALARSAHFPWRGKSFRPLSETRGEGINRVVSDRLRLFRFTTFIGRSRAGAFDAVQLDYDHASNPFFIRAIKDEIRELSPGLYLGQAYAEVSGTAHLALYFGLQSATRSR